MKSIYYKWTCDKISEIVEYLYATVLNII